MATRVFNYKAKNWHNADVDDVSLFFEDGSFYLILAGEFGENRFDVPQGDGGPDFLQTLRGLDMGILEFRSHQTVSFEMEPQYIAIIMKWCKFFATTTVPVGGVHDLHKPNWEEYGEFVSRYEAYSDFKITVNSRPWVICLGRDGVSNGRVAIPVNLHDEDVMTYTEAKWELTSRSYSAPETSEFGIVDNFEDGWLYIVREKNPNFMPVYELLDVSNSAEGISLWLSELEERREVVDLSPSFVHSLEPARIFLELAKNAAESFETNHTEKLGDSVVSEYHAIFEMFVAEWENYTLAIRLTQELAAVENCESMIKSFNLEKTGSLIKYEKNADEMWFTENDFNDSEAEFLKTIPNMWESLGSFYELDYAVQVNLEPKVPEDINRFIKTLFTPFRDLNRLRWEVRTHDGQILTAFNSEYRSGPLSELDYLLGNAIRMETDNGEGRGES